MVEPSGTSKPEAEAGPETLTIVLEPLQGSVLKSIVNALGQSGAGTWRFVAVSPTGHRVEGPTFMAPRALGRDQTPHPQWAPDMPKALESLQDELERDGWHRGSLGEQPWAWTYHR